RIVLWVSSWCRMWLLEFFAGYEKSCQCIGIKTGHCPFGAACDGGSFGCIGICKSCECRKLNSVSGNWEKVLCD
ncbi:MAG: hypothetical protein NTW30_03015, partial [Candidatus Aenigmarchaeota archaeon]|nr:hypothetical protein [Candidatus Aenigmarchaeota archaeon]